MSETREEQLLKHAKAWLTADQQLAIAQSEIDGATRRRDEAASLRKKAAVDMMGHVGQNVPRRVVIVGDDVLLVMHDHGVLNETRDSVIRRK